MLHVVIADDEERICRLIQALGEWDRLGMEISGVAHDGPEALALIRDKRPDVLITDIRMPGLNGLDLIAQARCLIPSLEVIIISGYAQFDYAQTAIRYAVGEYLLKPINREALNRTLSEMAGRCAARCRSEETIATLETGRSEDRQQLRVQLPRDLALGRLTDCAPDALDRAYRFRAAGDALCVMLLRPDSGGGSYDEAALAIVHRKASEILCPLLDAVCDDQILSEVDGTITGVLALPLERLDEGRARLRDGLNQLLAQRGLFGGVDFTMALGVAPDAAHLPDAYRHARDMLMERLVEGTGRLLEGEAPPSGLMARDYQTRYAQDAGHALDVMSAEDADRAVQSLAQSAGEPGAHGWELMTLVRGAATFFVMRLGLTDAPRRLEEFAAACARCASAAGLFDLLRDFQRELLAQTEKQRADRDAQPIRDAKTYILRHYAEPITLEEVSDAIGFSASYFSTLFKKETGEGFAKYLTRVRMDAARELLRDTRKPIAEICRLVGYGDVKHFTHTFRAECGVNPGEYRKLYG